MIEPRKKSSDEKAQEMQEANAKNHFHSLITLAKTQLAAYKAGSFYGWLPFWLKEHSGKVDYLSNKFATLEKASSKSSNDIESKDESSLTVDLKLVCLVAELQFSKIRYENKIAHAYDVSDGGKGAHIIDYTQYKYGFEEKRYTETNPEVIFQKNNPNKHYFYKTLCHIVDSEEFKKCFAFIDAMHLHNDYQKKLTALIHGIKDKPYGVPQYQIIPVCKTRPNG